MDYYPPPSDPPPIPGKDRIRRHDGDDRRKHATAKGFSLHRQTPDYFRNLTTSVRVWTLNGSAAISQKWVLTA